MQRALLFLFLMLILLSYLWWLLLSKSQRYLFHTELLYTGKHQLLHGCTFSRTGSYGDYNRSYEQHLLHQSNYEAQYNYKKKL